jgi:molybdate/tungstate transport system ATP-binding protein
MIEINDISIKQAAFSLNNISFVLNENTYYCMIGKTGSGKTTLLEILCGLRKFDSGSIFINGNNVSNHKPGERGIGYVPQDIIMFNHMTVYNNIGFSLKVRNINGQAKDERIREVAKLLSITHLLQRKPFGLSGGEKQRVAIGRAICFFPNILLLDEPFSSLDRDTKEELFDLIKLIRQETNVTVLHVTHNIEEVRSLADNVLELKNGKIELKDKKLNLLKDLKNNSENRLY